MKKITIFLMLILLLSGCQKQAKNVPFEYREFFAMDTVMRIQLYDHSSEENFKAFENRVRELEAILSATVEGSDIDKINEAGGKEVQVHPETYELLQKSLEVNAQVGKVFDPTIAKVSRLWNIGKTDERVPSQQEITEALKYVGYKQIKLIPPNKVQVPDGVVIELGAIAKGYTADQLNLLAEQLGIKAAIINLGGNVYARGDKAGNNWKVSIQDPNEIQNISFCTITGKNFTIVTSGDYERFFIKDGIRYHHILDPATGKPTDNELRSVSIITENSTMADGYSTSLFVLGLEKALDFCDQHPEINAVFVTKDNKVYITKGLKDRFTLDNTTYTLKIGKDLE